MKTQGINILLIEDDEVDVMNVKRSFTKKNILNPIYVASNGLEALAMLRTDENGAPPAISANNLIIVLDINMPKMGGIEFLQELRKDSKLQSIPVIIFTTSNQEREKVEAYKLNIAGYIVKPVEPSQFVETMSIINRYWTTCELP